MACRAYCPWLWRLRPCEWGCSKTVTSTTWLLRTDMMQQSLTQCCTRKQRRTCVRPGAPWSCPGACRPPSPPPSLQMPSSRDRWLPQWTPPASLLKQSWRCWPWPAAKSMDSRLEAHGVPAANARVTPTAPCISALQGALPDAGLGHALFIACYTTLKMPEVCSLKTSASNAEFPPSQHFSCSCSALLSSTTWWRRGAACSCCCCAVELGPGSHLIQNRLLDCSICCALHLPTSWNNVQEVLSDTVSTSYKDEHVKLVLTHATCLPAQGPWYELTPYPFLALYYPFLALWIHISTRKNAKEW